MKEKELEYKKLQKIEEIEKAFRDTKDILDYIQDKLFESKSVIISFNHNIGENLSNCFCHFLTILFF
ncbi:MAG: hypothetical protein Q8K30_01665 [Candidatus Gracilibacteria bacterium]|nr:hypothetical protein [Candidatus Gracilibacteria bacterium]